MVMISMYSQSDNLQTDLHFSSLLSTLNGSLVLRQPLLLRLTNHRVLGQLQWKLTVLGL